MPTRTRRRPERHPDRPLNAVALRTAMSAHLRAVIDLGAFGGLRIGEVLALQRQHVDPLHGRLHVRQSVNDSTTGSRVGPTKTHQQRSVSLPPSMVGALVAHLDAYVGPEPDAWLFASRAGTPLRYGGLRRAWDAAGVEAGLAVRKPSPPIPVRDDGPKPLRLGKPGPAPQPRLRDEWDVLVTPQNLRQSCASWVTAHEGVLAAAHRLGHSRASTTTAFYARVLPGSDVGVAATLDRLRQASL